LTRDNVFSKDPNEILNYLKDKGKIISVQSTTDIFKDVNLSIHQFVDSSNSRLFKSRDKLEMREEEVLSIPGIESLVNEFGAFNYLSELMDMNYDRFISLENFILNDREKLIATKDFRVILKDNKGTIPESVKLNIASVAYLMLGGLMSEEAGYAYITEKMRQYGVCHLLFDQTGYVTINLSSKETEKNYRMSLNMGKTSSP
jgi:hypothetical protein